MAEQRVRLSYSDIITIGGVLRASKEKIESGEMTIKQIVSVCSDRIGRATTDMAIRRLILNLGIQMPEPVSNTRISGDVQAMVVQLMARVQQLEADLKAVKIDLYDNTTQGA